MLSRFENVWNAEHCTSTCLLGWWSVKCGKSIESTTGTKTDICWHWSALVSQFQAWHILAFSFSYLCSPPSPSSLYNGDRLIAASKDSAIQCRLLTISDNLIRVNEQSSLVIRRHSCGCLSSTSGTNSSLLGNNNLKHSLPIETRRNKSSQLISCAVLPIALAESISRPAEFPKCPHQPNCFSARSISKPEQLLSLKAAAQPKGWAMSCWAWTALNNTTTVDTSIKFQGKSILVLWLRMPLLTNNRS